MRSSINELRKHFKIIVLKIKQIYYRIIMFRQMQLFNNKFKIIKSHFSSAYNYTIILMYSFTQTSSFHRSSSTTTSFKP